MNMSMIESQFNYQTNIRKCVVVVYDPVKTVQGTLALQAFRLSNEFLKLYQDQNFTPEQYLSLSFTSNFNFFYPLCLSVCLVCLFVFLLSHIFFQSLTASGMTHADIFQEIPIRIHNSSLATALLYELESREVVKPDHSRLEMTDQQLLKKNLEFLIDETEELISEQNKLQFHYRAVQRQQQSQSKWVQQRVCALFPRFFLCFFFLTLSDLFFPRPF